MMADSILEILLKAQRYVESLGGRFSARIIIWPMQIMNVYVESERVPNHRSANFEIGVLEKDPARLKKELEELFDRHLSPKWREAE